MLSTSAKCLLWLAISVIHCAYPSKIIIVEEARACFRRLLVGRRVTEQHIRRSLPTSSVALCQEECSIEKHFTCEGFNFRNDNGFGRGSCELTGEPYGRLDPVRDFYLDRDYDYYERDRDSAPECNVKGNLYGNVAPYGPWGNEDGQGYKGQNWQYGHNGGGYGGGGGHSNWNTNSGGDQGGLNQGHSGSHWNSGPRPSGHGDNSINSNWAYWNTGGGNQNPGSGVGHSGGGHHQTGHEVGHYGGGGHQSGNRYPPNEDNYPHSGGNYPHSGGNYPQFGSGGGHYNGGGSNTYGGSGGGSWGGRPSEPWNGGNAPGSGGKWRPEIERPWGGRPEGGRPESGRPWGPSSGGGGGWGGGGQNEVGHSGGGQGYLPPVGRKQGCFFRSRTGFRLERGVVHHALNVPSVHACEQECLFNEKLNCKTFSYRYSPEPLQQSENCQLSTLLYRDFDPYIDFIPERDFDIYEKNEYSRECNVHPPVQRPRPPIPQEPKEPECFLRVRSGQRFSRPVIKDTSNCHSLGECELQCLRAKFFTCRTFSYRYGSAVIGGPLDNCELSDWTFDELDPRKDFVDDLSFVMYERGSYGYGCEINHYIPFPVEGDRFRPQGRPPGPPGFPSGFQGRPTGPPEGPNRIPDGHHGRPTSTLEPPWDNEPNRPPGPFEVPQRPLPDRPIDRFEGPQRPLPDRPTFEGPQKPLPDRPVGPFEPLPSKPAGPGSALPNIPSGPGPFEGPQRIPGNNHLGPDNSQGGFYGRPSSFSGGNYGPPGIQGSHHGGHNKGHGGFYGGSNTNSGGNFGPSGIQGSHHEGHTGHEGSQGGFYGGPNTNPGGTFGPSGIQGSHHEGHTGQGGSQGGYYGGSQSGHWSERPTGGSFGSFENNRLPDGNSGGSHVHQRPGYLPPGPSGPQRPDGYLPPGPLGPDGYLPPRQSHHGYHDRDHGSSGAGAQRPHGYLPPGPVRQPPRGGPSGPSAPHRPVGQRPSGHNQFARPPIGPAIIRAPDEVCYIGYGGPARLLPSAIRASLTVPTEEKCKQECTKAREEYLFHCTSLSYHVLKQHHDVPNCLLSDIGQRDLRPGVDYAHEGDNWMFAWNTLEPLCDVKDDKNHYEGHFFPGRDDVSTWQRFTVSGKPCRGGTICVENREAGFWSCELEGGEPGSWDYCCRQGHQCGFSEGYNYPWCYVGSAAKDQWRPCSERYYPHSGAFYGQTPSTGRPDAANPYGPPRYWPVSYLHHEGPSNVSVNYPSSDGPTHLNIQMHHDRVHSYEEHPQSKPDKDKTLTYIKINQENLEQFNSEKLFIPVNSENTGSNNRLDDMANDHLKKIVLFTPTNSSRISIGTKTNPRERQNRKHEPRQNETEMMEIEDMERLPTFEVVDEDDDNSTSSMIMIEMLTRSRSAKLMNGTKEIDRREVDLPSYRKLQPRMLTRPDRSDDIIVSSGYKSRNWTRSETKEATKDDERVEFVRRKIAQKRPS